ncbi:phosphonate metabolism protein/1,5-bisphosphokinase (PRPP-forming) PhnN [Pseudorhodoplanes sinuspersici]|uniref:Ribose 1,5-bisphosphate phosphokinase PhnN n=1 Tax=Pseudorhodoplanes sinuspersici TaxID=1235591 RepID=A0A1W6ZZE2_9HYPH|nr:phosphonate metabolism protein/1,5-bisphosphokinase (PRPP-forming) PhnN [Pseudorhodoplanes sinuspersici]ARQ02501.1 phosphonate metabolism protein/1,5-bisphosphokinase (PRPP-forming) PhnN [Pseudorhodoplanes sinuspersici]RKE74341.1 ribose 1,5-bisphosphokinase [Pseudorhodoplanes sinuspersici]
MSVSPNPDRALQARIGPGALVAVCGPSGAGKDSLLRRVQERNNDAAWIVFPRRTVTRLVSDFEEHDTATPEEFDRTLASGGFAFWWDAHGLKYGLAASIDEDIRAGRCVMCNVSRTVIPGLRHKYSHVVAVLVTAPQDVLQARLAARGRATDGDLSQRMARSAKVSDNLDVDLVIENTGSIDDGARQLLDALESRLTSTLKI